MTVYVELSDSLWEFGEIVEDGSFTALIADIAGVFEGGGGDVKDFAIRWREREGDEEIYTAARHGSCELMGPALRPERAIYPRLEEPYYSIAGLTFVTEDRDSVFAELTTTAPNGFTRPDN